MNIPNHPLYGQAEFICGALRSSQYPPDRGAEVIFLGRSNAGKSSAINTVTGIHGLARTSKTPGRTQQINFFRLAGERRLVDPPGYGYAAVPTAVKHRWLAALEAYLNQRRSLQGVVLLMDIRHPLSTLDDQMLTWCQHAMLPVYVLLTKADKLSQKRACAALDQTRHHLATRYGPMEVQPFSATCLRGKELARLRSYLDGWLGFRDLESAAQRNSSWGGNDGSSSHSP